MEENWKQPVCDPCYGTMFPNSMPERLDKVDFPDKCAICGRETFSGIWLSPVLPRKEEEYDEA